MFRKILLCVDLSPASVSLVRCIGKMKKLGFEDIVLAHVIYVANTPGLEVMLEDEARPFLVQQKNNLEDQGYKVSIDMPFGLPAHTLAEAAESHNVDLVVIGSHSRSIIGETFLGSVSAKLLSLIRRPVLLVNRIVLEGKDCGSVCCDIFDNILFPTDFSETSERVMPYVKSIAVERECPVTLLHVVADTELGPVKADQPENTEQLLLDAKRQRLERCGVTRIVAVLGRGDPAQEICKRVSDGISSLVVMSSTGKGVAKELFIGSVAKQVARHANVPVLFIPATEEI